MLQTFAPIGLLLFLSQSIGIWIASLTTVVIVIFSTYFPPGQFQLFDRVPRAKVVLSIMFGGCMLAMNALTCGAAVTFPARTLGIVAPWLLLPFFLGSAGYVTFAIAIDTPLRSLLIIPPEIRQEIRQTLRDDEPSDAPKDRASRFDNGNSTAGPR